MKLLEGLAIVLALQLIVFAMAEHEGSRLKVLTKKKLFIVWLIFFLGQAIAMGLGYQLSRLPFIPRRLELVKTYSGISAGLFLAISVLVFYRSWRWKIEEERLRELAYKRIALEAVVVGAYTFIAGIGYGLMNANLGMTFLIVFIATVVAVLLGLQTGYTQGDRFHRHVYIASGSLFALTGIWILVQHL